MSCYRTAADGIVVMVRLTPRAAGDSIDGIDRISDGSEVAKVRVRAVPACGAANQSLVALLADALHVPKREVRIIAGATARLKQVHVTGDVLSMTETIEQWPRLF